VAALQYPPGALVVPIDDYMLEYIDVSLRRHRLEEVTTDHSAAVRDAGVLQNSRGLRHHVRQISQNAPRLWVLTQERGQQRPVPAAHVHDRAESREVVRAQDPGCL